MKTKIKKYEVLLYKMDLENQGYKDEIQKYQNQLSTVTGQNINFIPIYKIDLNSELENIDGNNDEKNNFNDGGNNEVDNEDNNEDNNNNKETIDNNESNYINEDEKFKTSGQQINTEFVNENENDNDNDNDDNDNYEENNSEENNENKHIYNIKNK